MTSFSRRDAIKTAAAIAVPAAMAENSAAQTAAPTAADVSRTRLHRGFVDLSYGQLHYRARMPPQSVAPPLLMLHGFPSSAWILQPYVEVLGTRRRTWALDLPGMGDSSAHPNPTPSLNDLGASVLEAADALALPLFDLYGTLTGARVAIEIAIAAPRRVRRLILDEPGGLPHDEAEFLARYIPDMTPHPLGMHFQTAFSFCRDAYIWFPWYRRTLAAQRNFEDMPTPATLHGKTMEILKSQQLPAVFASSIRYNTRARAPLVTVPTLTTDELASVIPGARSIKLPRIEAVSATPAQLATRIAAFTEFLDA